VFAGLAETLTVPILIAQHMPPVFTGALAKNIAKQSGRPSAEGKDGELVKPGRVYVAPGNYHMVLVRHGADVRIRLNQGPQENYCRPSADPPARQRRRNLRRQYPGPSPDRHGLRWRGGL